MRHRPSCRSRAMRVLRELYPIERALAEHLPHLRGPQRRGLALWVLGAVLAQSACQAAVLAARGLWSPRLWKRVRALGWHPLLRIQRRTTIPPDGRERCPAGSLVRPGEAWVGRGRLGWPKGRR